MKERDRFYDRFHDLLGQIQDDLLDYASAISGSQQKGHDLFMDAYWEVLERFPDMRKKEPIPLKSYFLKVIKHRNANLYKEDSLLVRFEDEEVLSTMVLEVRDRTLEDENEADNLFEELDKLELPLRQALFLESEGLCAEDSAELMGKTVEEFRDLLEQVKEIMKGKLETNDTLAGDIKEITRQKEKTYLSVKEICEGVNMPWARVVRRLSIQKAKARNLDQVENLWDIQFPEELVNSLKVIPQSTGSAGNWLTVSGMANKLNVDHRWVLRRLLFLSHPGEYRGNTTRVTLHLPPESLEELSEMRSQVKGPPKQDELTLRQLADEVGKHRNWVERRLNKKGIKPQLRRGNTGRRVKYYSRELVNELKQELSQNFQKGDWLTIPDLVEGSGRGRDWVTARLEELKVDSELRHIFGSGRLESCYPCWVLNDLRSMAREYNPALDGWNTKSGLEQKLGKSYNWLTRRLNLLEPITKEFLDSQGVVRTFYPPKVLEELIQMKNEQVEKRNAPKWYEK